MIFELSGVIHTIFPGEKYGDFHKRVFWLSEVDSSKKYPEVWAFELWHDDGQDIDMHKVGDSIKVSFDVKGKIVTLKGTNKQMLITTLKAWKIEKTTFEMASRPKS